MKWLLWLLFVRKFAFLRFTKWTSASTANVNDLRAIRKQVSGAANQALLTKVSHTIKRIRTYSSNDEWSLRKIFLHKDRMERMSRFDVKDVRPFHCYASCFDNIAKLKPLKITLSSQMTFWWNCTDTRY